MRATPQRTLLFSIAVHLGVIALARLSQPTLPTVRISSQGRIEFTLSTPTPWRQIARAVDELAQPSISLQRNISHNNIRSANSPLATAAAVRSGQTLSQTAGPSVEPTPSIAQEISTPSAGSAFNREGVFGPRRDTEETYPTTASSGQTVLAATGDAVTQMMVRRETREALEHAASPTNNDEPTGIQGAGGMSNNLQRLNDGWREDVNRQSAPPRPAGATNYLRQVARVAGQQWHPVQASDPGLAQSVLGVLTGGQPAYEAATRDSLGVFASDRGAAAAQELDAVHPHSPTLRPSITLGQAGRATATRHAVEIEVDHAPNGTITNVRVVRTSGTRSFDQQAVRAIREAVTEVGIAPAGAAPGVAWRVRWEFELRVARNPPFSLNNGAAGEPPGLNGASLNLISGGVEWGGVDPPRVQLPFGLQRYQRIRALWAQAIQPSVAHPNSRSTPSQPTTR